MARGKTARAPFESEIRAFAKKLRPFKKAATTARAPFESEIRAFAKKLRPFKKAATTARARKISRSLKVFHAKAHRIWASEPGITYRDAQKLVKETFIGTIRRAGETYTGRFVELEQRGKYKRIPEGKPALRRYSVGKPMTFQDVERARGVGEYWALVKRLARQFDLTIDKARNLVRDIRDDMEQAQRFRKALGIQGPGSRRGNQIRARDVAGVIERSDHYPKTRKRYGI